MPTSPHDPSVTDHALILATLRTTATIKKRDGTLVKFDEKRITDAIEAAFREVLNIPTMEILPSSVSSDRDGVVHIVLATLLKQASPAKPLDVETIQDRVEEALMNSGFHEIAKAYIEIGRAHL